MMHLSAQKEIRFKVLREPNELSAVVGCLSEKKEDRHGRRRKDSREGLRDRAGEWVEIAASKGDQLEASRPAGGYEVKQITFGKSPDVSGSAFDASWLLPAGEQQHSVV